MQVIAESWLLPIAHRVFALDPLIRSVCWTLRRDGDELLEDWIPSASAAPVWPDVLDDNPWLDDERLDEVLTDACLELRSPDLSVLAATADERVFAVVGREGGLRWTEAAG